jgi:hypothetical protein
VDFVARAKAFLNSGAAVGLIVVTLFAAAPAFGQNSTLRTGNFSCNTSYVPPGTDSGNCTSECTVSQLGAINGIEGLTFFDPSSGSYSFSDFSSSGSV